MHYRVLLSLLFLGLPACGFLGIFGGDDKPAMRVPATLLSVPDPPVTAITPTPAPTLTDAQKAQVEEDDQLSLRKRVIVLDFQNRTPYGGRELGQHAAEVIRTELSKSPKFVVLPPEQFEEIQELVPEHGAMNYHDILSKARALGADVVALGTIEEMRIAERGGGIGLFHTHYDTVDTTVKLQLYDSSTETPMLAKVSSADLTEEHTELFGSQRSPQSYDADRGDNAVGKAIDKVMPALLAQARRLAWVGHIAKGDGHHYYVRGGKLTGIPRGQLLKVFGPGEPILDDASKELVGVTPGRFKGFLRVVDSFGDDGTIAVVQSGSGFAQNDRVEIYSGQLTN